MRTPEEQQEHLDREKAIAQDPQPGHIYRTSWGYDQTNVEFFPGDQADAGHGHGSQDRRGGYRRSALWMGVKSAEVVTPEIQGRGLRWLSRTREGDFLLENDVFETDRMVGYKTIEGPFAWVGGFRLDPIGEDETRVTSFGRVTLTGFRRLLEWLFAGQVRKGEAAELTKLKALVETNPG
jgi:hypothetical protein